jgi:uncharacterized protein
MVSLRAIAKMVSAKHPCHTLILYGSWARGDATPASDVDLLAIANNKLRDIEHDTRKWRGVYLDIFVYPESKVKAGVLMHVRGGKVLKQRGQLGDQLLEKLDRKFRQDPKPLSPSELAVRKAWHLKMLDRAAMEGAEANYRRVWLLTALLEDYFALRNRWYEGPKISLQWLRENAPTVHRQFEAALKPDAELSAIRSLVKNVGRVK